MISEIPSCSFCKKQFSKYIYFHEHMKKQSPCCSASEEYMETKIKQIADLEKLLKTKRTKDQMDFNKNKKDSENFQKKFETEHLVSNLSNIKMHILQLFSKIKNISLKEQEQIQIYNDEDDSFV
jgi:hypothetical protein